jgi:hypothetical protein
MNTPATTFTVFCQESGGNGTIHIASVEATDLKAAIIAGKQQCIDDWSEGFTPEQSRWNQETGHCLGIAAGSGGLADGLLHHCGTAAGGGPERQGRSIEYQFHQDARTDELAVASAISIGRSSRRLNDIGNDEPSKRFNSQTGNRSETKAKLSPQDTSAGFQLASSDS